MTSALMPVNAVQTVHRGMLAKLQSRCDMLSLLVTQARSAEKQLSLWVF